MQFSTALVALVAALPAFAAPVPPRGPHGHPHPHHHHEERSLEERAPEPKGHGFAKAAGHFAGHAASSYMNQKRDGHRAHGGHGQGHHPHGSHHQQQVSERDLEERSPEPKGHGFAKAAGHFAKHAAAAYNEKRDGHRAHGGHGQGHHPHGSHHQQQVSERDFDDFEELEARDLEERSPEPKGHGFAKAAGHFAKHAAAAYNEKRDGHRAHGGHGQGHHPHGGHHQQQVSERDFDDFEELEARDLVEEIEARSFDEPVDIDLMIRELGSADEDALYF